MEKLIVYEFIYSSCIHESSAGTISIHKTEKGAQIAMEFHRENERKEWYELYAKNNPFNAVFGEHEFWGVREVEVKD